METMNAAAAPPPLRRRWDCALQLQHLAEREGMSRLQPLCAVTSQSCSLHFGAAQSERHQWELP